MLIVLNGDNVEAVDGSSIAKLLTQLDIGLDRVAVEVNLDIVPKAQYDAYILAGGDRVEIVHFVGGG
jgi:sulfur carrier protein